MIKCECGCEFEPVIEYRHRLICGDCTDAATVARVMSGEKAALVFTDPPYDGELGKGVHGFVHSPDVRKRTAKMALSIEDIHSFDPASALELCESITAKPAAWFFFCNLRLVPAYINYALETGRGFDLLLWHKPNFLPMAGNHYFPDTEYLVKIRDSGANFNNGIPKERISYGTYWIIESQKGDRKEADHPTVKPLQIIESQVLICSKRGELVFDPFAGSGTTGVACERLGRKARLIEIAPAYCAVILERMATVTGQTPTRLAGPDVIPT